MKIDARWTGNFLLTLSRMPQFGCPLDNNIYYMRGLQRPRRHLYHLAGRLISELLRGDAERFDAFANLPTTVPGGRSLRIPFTAMGAAYYSLRDRRLRCRQIPPGCVDPAPAPPLFELTPGGARTTGKPISSSGFAATTHCCG